ncbi:MAG: hypothetical protein U5K69_21885 [Balneolaceae bacterium]|nr:hypothetical protein [Balneolaceae bacterium]
MKLNLARWWTAASPDKELDIVAPEPGWAEQNPETWWEARRKGHSRNRFGGFYRYGRYCCHRHILSDARAGAGR